MVSNFRFYHIGFRILAKKTIRYHQVDEVEALVKDLVAASQKTKEALELVTNFHAQNTTKAAIPYYIRIQLMVTSNL